MDVEFDTDSSWFSLSLRKRLPGLRELISASRYQPIFTLTYFVIDEAYRLVSA
jgi:hypothetical protein